MTLVINPIIQPSNPASLRTIPLTPPIATIPTTSTIRLAIELLLLDPSATAGTIPARGASSHLRLSSPAR